MLTGRGPHGTGTEAASGPLPCIPGCPSSGAPGFPQFPPSQLSHCCPKPLAFPLPAPPLSSALVPSSCSSPATDTLHPPGAHLPRLETCVFCACVGASPGDRMRATHVQVFSPRSPWPQVQGTGPAAMPRVRWMSSSEPAPPNASPCVCSLLQLVISGPVQQSPHAALPPGFYPHIHTPPLGYGAVPAHPAAHPALPTHPGHTFLSGMTFPFRPIR